MKKILSFLAGIIAISFSLNSTYVFAGTISSLDGNPSVNVDCGGTDCDLQTGVDLIKNEVNGIETTKSFSEYIQDLVLYAIGFVSLIALIYIIYSGFNILFSGGEDEKLKKSKTTILYVVLGIALIWMAYPITMFIIDIFN